MDDITDEEELDRDFHRVRSSRLVREFRPREGIMRRFLEKVENIDQTMGESSEDIKTYSRTKSHVNIFISYCWHTRKEAVHEMANYLKQQPDLNVWIDMENMSGYAYESMAKGIDEADIVLCFFSHEYAESANCRREIEYAANKNKDILPIRVERGYRPDGWLLFIFKSQMRFDFCEGDTFQDVASKICDYIRSAKSATTNHNGKHDTRNSDYKTNVNFKCGGVPFFSKSKYYSRPEDESRILNEMKNVAENPDDGCLVISGDGGVGKTTTISRLFMDEKNQAFFVSECNLNRAIWINCFDWRERFDEKAFVDKIVNVAKELEESDRSANFNNLQGISSYYQKKNLRVAFILDDMFNYRLLQSFLEKQSESPVCFVVTRDAQSIIESNFGMVKKVERLEEMNDDGIRNMLKSTFKLNKQLNEEQLLRLAKLCCGLPLIASLIAARISNCEDADEVRSEYKTLISPQYKISDLRTQNRSFKTVSNLFTFSLDQMDASLRSLYYAFLLFNPAEPVSIFDLGVLWGFDLDEENRCGLRGVCRAFEKRSLVRRVKKQIAEKEESQAEKEAAANPILFAAFDDRVMFDDATEDRFLLHQMLYESALEKAKKDFGLRGSDSECLGQVRVKIVSGDTAGETSGDSSGLGVVLAALKFQRRPLLERVVTKLEPNDLAQLCLKKSPQTDGMTFAHYLYTYKWQKKSKAGLLTLFVGDLHSLSGNPCYRVLKQVFNKLVDSGGSDLLWRVVNEPQMGNQYSSLFMEIGDSMENMNEMVDRLTLVTKIRQWKPIYWEKKWEARLHDPKSKTEPLVMAAFRGDLDGVTSTAKTYEAKVIEHATRVAARRGHLEILRFLVENWPDSIKSTNSEGRLPIMLAAHNNNLEVVRFLWEKWPESLKCGDAKGANAIIWACKSGSFDCVRFLYEKDPEASKHQDNEGSGAFICAAAGGYMDVVEFLLEKNSDHLEIRKKDSASAIVAASATGQLHVVKFLYSKYETKDHYQAMVLSAACGQAEVVNYLLLRNPDLAKTPPVDEDFAKAPPPIVMAAMFGSLEIVEALYGRCDNYATVNGLRMPIIAFAIMTGHLDVVKWLFYKDPELAKARIGPEGPESVTPIALAEQMGRTEIAKFLKDNI